MNTKKNRKGFTIVELVIVIAVIAILATVLVPTFGDVISKANKSAALQEAKNIYTEYVAAVDYAKGDVAKEELYILTTKGYYVKVEDDAVTDSAVATKDFTYADTDDHILVVSKDADGLTYTCKGACDKVTSGENQKPCSLIPVEE